MTTRPYKRRRILIDPFQYRLLFINLLYFCIILLVFAGALFLPLIFRMDDTTLSAIEQAEVAGQFLSLHARVWPAMFVAFLLLAVHSVFVSHRIAGPLYRFRSVFRAAADGDLWVRANLRKRDYLGKESEVLNEMMANLQSRIKGIEERYQEVNAVMTALQETIERGSLEDVNQKVEHLRARMEQLKASVGQFHTEPTTPEEEERIATTTHAPPSSEDPAPLTRS